MSEDALLRSAISSFESAVKSFDAARIALQAVMADRLPADDGVVVDSRPKECQHPESVEISTLGSTATVWLCPDCGIEF